jgi:Domain of unknown function (DUF6259)
MLLAQRNKMSKIESLYNKMNEKVRISILWVGCAVPNENEGERKMVKGIKTLNLVCTTIAVLLCSVAGAARPTDETVSWVVPVDAMSWKAVPAKVRTHELPNRLTGISSEEKVQQTSLYSVTKMGKGTSFEVVGNVSERRSMKWAVDLEPKALKPFNYYVLRYKAEGIRRSHERFAVLSVSGDDESFGDGAVTLLADSQVINDGKWHVLIGKKQINFMATTLNVELSTTNTKCSFVVDSLMFSSDLPDFQESFVHNSSWQVDKSAQDSFMCIELTKMFNDTYKNALENVFNKYAAVVDGGAFFKSERISMNGVPFSVLLDGKNIVRPPDHSEVNDDKVEFLGEQIPRENFFPIGRDDKTNVVLGKKASEVFLLLMSEFPDTVGRYGMPPVPFQINDIEAVAIELVYMDGESEFAFPYSIADDGFVIQRMLGAYIVAADQSKTLRSVVLHNRLFKKNINIVAVTINTSKQRVLLPSLTQEPVLVRAQELSPPSYREPYMEKKGNVIKCGNSFYDLTLNCENGFSLEGMVNRWSSDTQLSFDASSGLDVVLDERVLTGLDFNTESVKINGGTATIVLKSAVKSAPLTFTLSISVDKTSQIAMKASVLNSGDASLSATIKFPIIKNLTIGKLEDTWMFMPQYQNIISNRKGFYLVPHGQGFPMQFYDVYNPGAGIGLTIITHNTTHETLYYNMSKTGLGVTASIQYPEKYYTLEPGQPLRLIETVLVPHAGDWHRSISIYKDWVNTWYKSQHASNREWFDRSFLVRTEIPSDVCSRKTNTTPPIFDHEKGVFRVDEVMKVNKEYCGFLPDILHFYGWHYDDKEDHYDWGDYSYETVGGLSTFKSTIKRIQNELEIPVSIYLLTDRMSKKSDITKHMGEKAARVKQDGTIVQNEKTLYNCGGAKDWQDHFVKTAQRVQKETGCKLIYLDVFGFWPHQPCYSKHHNHDIPSKNNKLSNQFITRVRKSLPSDVVLWSEYPLTDINSQYTDGNISYYFMPTHALFAEQYDIDRGDGYFSKPLQNMFRFVFPGIKQIDFPVGIENEANGANMLKFIFFNGVMQYDVTWRLYTQRTRDMLKHSLAVKKKLADCFSSEKPVPLVPTERAYVYANKFPGNGRTAWTLYNGRYTTVRGPVIAIEHHEGATYYDAWKDKVISPEIIDGKATINMKLGPQGLGCVVQKLTQN